MTTPPERKSQHHVIFVPPGAKLTIPIVPDLPDGWVPFVPSFNGVRIVEWDKSSLTVENTGLSVAGTTYSFVRAQTRDDVVLAGQVVQGARALFDRWRKK
jgi:hypothetical protein